MMGIVATILLARNGERGNGGGWIQLLIFVILGLVYALGGLAKMKANKAAAKERDKPGGGPEREPRYKPLDDSIPPRQAKPKRAAAPEVEVSRIAPRPAGEIRRPPEVPVRRERRHMAQVPEAKKGPVRRPAAKPTLPAIKKPIPSSVMPSELGKIEKLEVDLSRRQKEAKAKSAGRPVLDYEDPDALREAIVHYEIFGRPLSLREPAQHIWEL